MFEFWTNAVNVGFFTRNFYLGKKVTKNCYEIFSAERDSVRTFLPPNLFLILTYRYVPQLIDMLKYSVRVRWISCIQGTDVSRVIFNWGLQFL